MSLTITAGANIFCLYIPLISSWDKPHAHLSPTIRAVCMRYLSAILFALIVTVSNSYSQSISHQSWQSQTISSDSITVACATLILPFDKGSLLVETNPTTIRGEMDSALRSSHPIRISLQPQSGTSDTLTTISGCTVDGAELQLATADIGDVVTIEHTEGAIQFVDGTDFVLDNPTKILSLVRKNGIWVPLVTGGISGGNIVVGDGNHVDFGGITLDEPGEGLIVPGATNCAFATAFLQFCFDYDDRIIYIGTGTGIVPIAGEGVSGCFNLDNCFDLGQTINGLNGRGNALKLLDDNNDGVLIYVDANGLVFECVTDYGGGSEAPCKPTEIRSFMIPPEAFAPDATHFVHNSAVVLNAQIVNTTITAADDNAAILRVSITMPNRWDGEIFVIESYLHTLEASPGGEIDIDWVGYCVVHGASNAHSTYPTPTVDGKMLIDLDGHAQHDLVITPTAGDVPLTGCTGDEPKVLWLKGQIAATTTTASDLGQQHIFKFMARYGLKSFTD